MSSPCLSPEFSLDSGDRVQVNLCGPPNQQDWPFNCSARLNNGLHRDADGCLWVAPLATGLAFTASGSATCPSFCGYSRTSSVYSNSVVAVNLTNTNMCRSRSFIVHTDYNFRTTFTTANGGVVQYHRQVTGVDGSDAGWQLLQTLDSGTTDGARALLSDSWTLTDLPPGETRTIRVGMRVNAADGTGTVNTFEARIGLFGISSG